MQEALDKVNTKLQENLSGVRVIKAYVRQKYEIAQFGSVNTNLTKINIRAVQLISLMMPIIMLVVSGDCRNIMDWWRKSIQWNASSRSDFGIY